MRSSIERHTAASAASPKPEHKYLFSLPLTSQLLTSGGDARIICEPPYNRNKYGCSPNPEPDVLAFGSSTASNITDRAFSAAERLRLRLLRCAQTETASAVYAREIARIRTELLDLCGLSKLPGVDVIFAASGTDIHLFAAQLANDLPDTGLLAVMIDPAETGSGVPEALAGRHFSELTALGAIVEPGTALFGSGLIDVAVVANRSEDGAPRGAATIDAEVEALVVKAANAGRRVLLNLVDVSKTGMIFPSLACAMELRQRFPDRVDVLVDACQFRLAPSTLHAYLQFGFWVALTGSKFVGGPPFSGALLVPKTAAPRLRARAIPTFRAYSALGDWPGGWVARFALTDVANFGLLLRWEAALVELRRFRSLRKEAIAGFLESFATEVLSRLSSDPCFQLLPVPKLDRCSLVKHHSWDQTPTIFPFILRHPRDSMQRGAPLRREETARLYKLLGQKNVECLGIDWTNELCAATAQRCRLGQPVLCGVIENVPVSALRLCASAPLVVDALAPSGRGPDMVIREALMALDKTAALAGAIEHLDCG
jgi:hypothetical protein